MTFPVRAGPVIEARSRTLRVSAVFAVLAVLLFTNSPGGEWHPALRALWNLGHLPLAGLGAWLLWQTPLAAGLPPRQRAPLLWLLILLAGLLVEVAQRTMGRSFAWTDLALDGAGAALALLWLARFPPDPKRRLALVSFIALSALAPAVVPIADSLLARVQFPVLADFSTPFQAQRFSGSAYRDTTGDGLRVTFAPGADYSTLTLRHFPPDWTRTRQLKLVWSNPSPEPLQLSCKLFDGEHERRGLSLNDRFTIGLRLAPGRTETVFDLRAVSEAPASRTMALDAMRELSCFTRGLQHDRELIIHRIALE